MEARSFLVHEDKPAKAPFQMRFLASYHVTSGAASVREGSRKLGNQILAVAHQYLPKQPWSYKDCRCLACPLPAWMLWLIPGIRQKREGVTERVANVLVVVACKVDQVLGDHGMDGVHL